jgi:hypothetical protein
MSVTDPVDQALARFNEQNAEDPTMLGAAGAERPRELVLAERLEEWVYRVVPEPSLALRLAARCQHLRRFAFPRCDYPEGRVGYLKWRKDLSKKHADLATELLRDVGFDEHVISAVRAINLKQELKVNSDSQAMEDALCLSFLQYEFADFSHKHPDDKVVDIVVKTWRKMSDRGRELALTIRLDGRAKELVERALSGGS